MSLASIAFGGRGAFDVPGPHEGYEKWGPGPPKGCRGGRADMYFQSGLRCTDRVPQLLLFAEDADAILESRMVIWIGVEAYPMFIPRDPSSKAMCFRI